jgi:hypothetical protein
MSTSVLAKKGASCFQAESVMTAPNFFKGLEYERVTYEGRSTDTFRKSGKVISAFPEELQIAVSLFTVPCSGNAVPPVSSSAVTALAQKLQLQVSWKKGPELRAANLTEPPQIQVPPATNPHIKNSFMWTYAFRVRSTEVPLTDHLVILVFDSENKQLLGRMTFDLVRQFTWHFSVN